MFFDDAGAVCTGKERDKERVYAVVADADVDIEDGSKRRQQRKVVLCLWSRVCGDAVQ